MARKRWYEEWQITWDKVANTITVEMPHVKPPLKLTVAKTNAAKKLTDLLDAALTEIAERDKESNGQKTT